MFADLSCKGRDVCYFGRFFWELFPVLWELWSALHFTKRGYIGRLNKRGLIFMVILSLYFGLTSTGVDNAAHIGGLICGFLLQVILGGLR